MPQSDCVPPQVPDLAIYVGRFSPLHMGHQRVIETMRRECGDERTLILLGSCNSPRSERLMFDFETRLSWFRTLYPSLVVSAIPDYGCDRLWLLHLQSMVHLWFRTNQPDDCFPHRIVFYTGDPKDVDFFTRAGFLIRECSRHDGSGPVISATEIRALLQQEKSIDQWVDSRIKTSIQQAFFSGTVNCNPL